MRIRNHNHGLRTRQVLVVELRMLVPTKDFFKPELFVQLDSFFFLRFYMEVHGDNLGLLSNLKVIILTAQNFQPVFIDLPLPESAS